MDKVKVAVVQLHSKPLDIDSNFKKASAFIRQAASQNARLVVLPEYHLNSYLPQDPVWIAQASRFKEYLDLYCALARELSICIVPGTLVERHLATSESTAPGYNTLESSDGAYHLFNTAYFISHTGEILGSYRKKNLWHTERAHQSRGQEKHSVIDTPLGKIGLLICWDLAFPEAFRELIRDGADMIIIPTCWTLDESSAYGLRLNPSYESLFLNSTITSRCFENTCAVVFANAGGPSDLYVGQSQVTLPFVGPVNGIWDSSEGLILAEIETEVLRESEKNYKVREDMATDGWHYSDIDNCVYLRGENEEIQVALSELIDRYFENDLGFLADEAVMLRKDYYQQYGMAIEGLVRHHQIDPLDHIAKVDDTLPLEDILQPDPDLRLLLEDIDRSKVRLWLLTNAYLAHAKRVLQLLGIDSLFDGLTFCDYAQVPFTCKPHKDMFDKAMRKAAVENYADCFFVDDSYRNCAGAQKVGWTAAHLIEEG